MTTQIALFPELERAIAHGSPERRAEMLSAVTDLFIDGSVGFTDTEIALFDDVITRLALKIEVSVRSLLAQRLASIAKGPPNIVRMLAHDDEISVAYPILAQSELLDESTLAQCARSKTQDHLLAISRRKSLSEIVTDVLVERGNRPVVLSIAMNPGAKFSSIGFSRLVTRSAGDETLTACVGSRPDIPHHLFLALLATASDLVRSKLIAEKHHARREIEQAVATVTDEIWNDADVSSTNYEEARAIVQPKFDSGELDDVAVLSFSESKKFVETTIALAYLCNVSTDVVEQALSQDQLDMILVLAKAAKLSWATTKMLLSFPGRQRRISSGEIEQCLASFERLNFATAQHIIEFYRMRHAQPARSRAAGLSSPH
jgi:uncharacterized protein (DUF2336 family)